MTCQQRWSVAAANRQSAPSSCPLPLLVWQLLSPANVAEHSPIVRAFQNALLQTTLIAVCDVTRVFAHCQLVKALRPELVLTQQVKFQASSKGLEVYTAQSHYIIAAVKAVNLLYISTVHCLCRRQRGSA